MDPLCQRHRRQPSKRRPPPHPQTPDRRAIAEGRRRFRDLQRRLFDGFRLDPNGRIWASAGDGVHCFDPDGTLLGKIRIPVSNLTFGDPKRTCLFITARESLYSVFVVPKGAAPG
ncbi:SMP-30/gluconolactonase/LRE family protein [Mesorhizobium sp. A623]